LGGRRWNGGFFGIGSISPFDLILGLRYEPNWEAFRFLEEGPLLGV